MNSLYQIIVYVPKDHLEGVKNALFDAGAGRIGDYEHCCWQTQGTGQFKPLEGSQPFIGQQGKVEQVKEFKVELVCAGERIKGALAAMLDAHPYEEPAYGVYPLYSLADILAEDKSP